MLRYQTDEFSDVVEFIAEPPIFSETPGDIPEQKPSPYYMRAEIVRPEVLTHLNMPIEGDVLSFDMMTRHDGEYYPPFRAKDFFSYALTLFESEGRIIKGIMHMYEDDHRMNTNFLQYEATLRSSGDRVRAIRDTWAYKQTVRVGYTVNSHQRTKRFADIRTINEAILGIPPRRIMSYYVGLRDKPGKSHPTVYTPRQNFLWGDLLIAEHSTKTDNSKKGNKPSRSKQSRIRR